MKRSILYFPDPLNGGGAAPASKPAAAAPAAPVAAPVASPAPAAPAPVESDDPFEIPKQPVVAAPAKPAAAAATAEPKEFDPERAVPKELREHAKRLKSENQTLAQKAKELEEKIKQVEARGGDTASLTGRLAAIEKERDDAMAQLRAARQEASPEFKEKYDKPFNQAAEAARQEISELTITNAEDGTTRQATWADFSALYSLPVGKFIEQANALFGPAAQFVIQKREQLQALDRARRTALEEEKAQFKQRDEKDRAESVRNREKDTAFLAEQHKRLAESVDDYKVDPTDKESLDAQKYALDAFDKAPESKEKGLVKFAHIRARVAAFAVNKVKLSRANAKIAELEAQVADLKGSAPGGTHRSTTAPVTNGDDDSMESFLEGARKAVTAA
jgi:DNA repair exonuclease SbcCD ATPase subunit